MAEEAEDLEEEKEDLVHAMSGAAGEVLAADILEEAAEEAKEEVLETEAEAGMEEGLLEETIDEDNFLKIQNLFFPDN